MKFKNNLKRFFTMSRQTGGFTLVELIVVIAILAILAGVAIPAYSGYIKKANEAADTQLLSAVNRALTAACMEKNVDMTSIPEHTVSLDAVEGGYRFNSAVLTSMTNKDGVKEAFDTYFAGNGTSVFKVYNILKYSQTTRSFEVAASKGVSIGGVTYYVSQEAIDNFKGSVFAGIVDDMQTQVDSLAGAYGEVVGSLTIEELAIFGDDYAAFLEANGVKDDSTGTLKGNATVLYIAQQSANMNANDAYNQLAAAGEALKGKENPTISDFFSAAQGDDPLSTAAMMYGAVTAYANSSNSADAEALKTQANNVQNAEDLAALFQAAYKSDGFGAYMGQGEPSDDFVRDMNGYLGAMSGMNAVSGSDSFDLNSDTAWSDDSVDQVLKDMLG